MTFIIKWIYSSGKNRAIMELHVQQLRSPL